MQLYIGIDGGQTSLKAALADAQGRVLGHGSGPGVIHLAAQGGAERFASSMRTAVAGAFAQAGLAPQAVHVIGLGISGVEPDSVEAAQVVALVPQVVPSVHIAVTNDADIALLGAHGGGPGMIAISGTGSIVLGRNAAGMRQRVGGWGWLLADEGSAFAIGRNGLRAALAADDRAGPVTRMQHDYLTHFGISDYRTLKRLVYAPNFGAAGFAGLAVVVSHAAQAGDGVANTIITTEAERLAADTQACALALGLPPQHARVAAMGGGFDNIHGLRSAFAHALAGSVAVVDAQASALQGAIWLARSGVSSGQRHV